MQIPTVKVQIISVKFSKRQKHLYRYKYVTLTAIPENYFELCVHLYLSTVHW